ncbi:hypothetical protein QQS21_011362 [Conoideocrella luteorostrata]|uniref:Uncharacterized protein n=1 Tax=Conoideocrella luteorostrata TaxID=1105319 RepID=A0AAJ0CFJ6_9HYPO|nr:hypothetical protein QQS21_011362 [Conoideocrella luteorostrata]
MSLPLKIRLAVRQHWEPVSSPANTAIQNAQSTLGRTISCTPDWAILHNSISAHYTDLSQLVSDATSFIQSWARAFQDVLEDGQSGEAFCDKLIEALERSAVSTVHLLVEVASSSTPSTKWDQQRTSFVLFLPKGEPPHDPAGAVPAFRKQIVSAFDERQPSSVVDAADREDWADVSVPRINASTSAPATAAAVPVVDAEPAYLPDVNLLPRPDELLLRPPYHLHITQGSCIKIECSHSPSLSFLEAYFKKWCRTNNRRTDRPPMVQITLGQSPFGLGPLHDVLTLEYPSGHYSGMTPVLSIPVVLHLVESVLGYTLVYSDSNSWQYRRDTQLRKM